MPFLKSYKPLLNLYLFLGVCPFSVNVTKNAVERSIFSLCYPVLFSLSLAIALLHFYVASMLHDDTLDTCDTGTCNYALIFQSLIIFVLFIISSIHTMFRRSEHVQLLNEIVDMETNVMKHFGIEMFPKETQRKICVRNSLLAFAQFAFNIIAIYGLELNQNWDITIYHFLFEVEMFTITLTVVHVIAICSTLKHCSQLLLNNVKALLQEMSSKNSVPNIKLYQIFYFLDRINEFKIMMCSVFGIRLLVNLSMDFVLLTVAVYYFILVNVPQQFAFHWAQVYFLFTYIIPVIFKNFALVATADTLGNQVSWWNRVK